MPDSFNNTHFSSNDWSSASRNGNTVTLDSQQGVGATLDGTATNPGDPISFSDGGLNETMTATDLDNANSIVLEDPYGALFYFSTASATAGDTITYANNTLGEFDPSIPVPTLALDPASDSGMVGDNITNDTMPVIEGTVGASDGTVTLFDGQTQIGAAGVDADGQWSVVTSVLAPGDHVLTATYADSSGNVSAFSSPLDLDIITETPPAPSAPGFTSPTGALEVNSAVSETTTPTITGTATANSSVELFDGNTIVGETTSDASGNWQIVAPPLALGAHVLTVTDADMAGNTSAPSVPLDLQVEPRSAITAVTVTTSTGGTTLGLGAEVDIRFSFNTPVVVNPNNGAAPAFDFNNGGVATYDAALSTPTEVVFAYTVAAGQNTSDLTLSGGDVSEESFTDINGYVPNDEEGANAGLPNTGITIATTPLTLQLADDTGSSATDGLTNDAALTGTGTPDGTVTLSENGQVVGSATVDATGNWNASASVLDLADGAHTVVASEAGLPDTSLAFTLDTTAPALAIRATTVSSVSAPVLAGTSEAGAIVALMLDGQALGTTTAGSDGTWTYQLASAVAAGTHAVTAQATDAAGNISALASGSLVELAPPVAGTSVLSDASVTLPQLLAGGNTLQLAPGTEQVQLADGVLSTGPDTQQAFLARLYEGLLGRAPDTAGLAGWNAQLNAGASDTTVAQGFLGSVEGEAATAGLSDQQFVADLYQGLLGRAATTAETDLWTGDLAGDASRAQVLSFIADSPESRTALASTTTAVWAPDPNAILVEATYATAFGRVPDPAGEQAWTNALAHGLSPADFEAAIAASPEFQSLHAGQSASALVTSFYENGLGRAPSAAELANAAGALQSGTQTAAGLLANVALSPEVNAHVAAILT